MFVILCNFTMFILYVKKILEIIDVILVFWLVCLCCFYGNHRSHPIMSYVQIALNQIYILLAIMYKK